ncbi:MAG TPA: DNA polymerase/3'-5' exonuclease PolX [Candidatus Methylomirabilis sp.]|nr:DNA polymerase/3'-5' exonuclease PolX [Candidatus Methylomirabilis sp.]
MKNVEIARLFDLAADLLEIRGDNPFRIRAYRRAAQSIETFSEDIEVVAREGRLDQISGIGKDLADKIGEYLGTGRMKDVDALLQEIPPGVVELMSVPGLGPKTAKLLYDKAGIRDVVTLETLARAGQLQSLPGIKAKAEANILKGIALIRRGQERMPLGRALALVEEVVAALRALPEVAQLELAGSIRRRKDTVGDIDILVTSSKPERVMGAFTGHSQILDVLAAGPTKASVRHREDIQIDLRVVEPDAFGAALVYFTGSKQHNIRIREMAVRKGLKISEYGVFDEHGTRVAGATEEDVYRAIGSPWIPPELREDTGEIEAALRGALPRLVEPADIRGDLHEQADAPDGVEPVEALADAARARGYQYIAVSDHRRGATAASVRSADAWRAHVERIRQVQRARPDITILASIECDILPDGSMDHPDEVLADVDIVVAAVRSERAQPRSEMTQRICRALAHPRVHILSHPTGRRVGSREPYDVDLDEVLQTARHQGKAVAIDASPEGTDLDDVQTRRAADLGALVAISTDAQGLGVSTARRAWIGPAQVVNTWPVQKLLGWAGRMLAVRSGKASTGRRDP